jgi:hypothetical protein
LSPASYCCWLLKDSTPVEYAHDDELRKRCFDPVVNPHTRLLVLGSLPGEVISGRALLRP